MTQKKNHHKFALPGDFIIDKIFKEYGSKKFYAKFKRGGYKFSPEVTSEWRNDYMNGVGICSQHDFFTNIDKWKSEYDSEFKGSIINYEVAVANILPIAAPLFFEQDNTPING